MPPLSLAPPKAVVAACKKGLKLKDDYAGKGLRPHTVEWAQHFAAGKSSEIAQARRMRAWFRRHKNDKRAGWDKPPTPGYVAWLLWGGDAGFRWVEKLVAQSEQEGTVDDAPTKKAIKPPAKKASRKKKKTKTRSRAKAKTKA